MLILCIAIVLQYIRHCMLWSASMDTNVILITVIQENKTICYIVAKNEKHILLFSSNVWYYILRNFFVVVAIASISLFHFMYFTYSVGKISIGVYLFCYLHYFGQSKMLLLWMSWFHTKNRNGMCEKQYFWKMSCHIHQNYLLTNTFLFSSKIEFNFQILIVCTLSYIIYVCVMCILHIIL